MMSHVLRKKEQFLLMIVLSLAWASGAGAAPPVTTDLVLHLDATSVTTVDINDETYVTTWHDQSGNGYDAISLGEPNMPRLVQDPLSGQPVLQFLDGNFMEIAHPANNDLDPLAGGFTVFVVVNRFTEGGVSYFLYKGNTSSFAAGYSMWADHRAVARINVDDINDNDHKYGLHHPLDYDEMILSTMVLDAGTMTAYYGGSTAGFGIWNDTTPNYVGSIVTEAPLRIAYSLQGYIGEILIYKRALSAAEVEQVGLYLTDKFYIASVYPSDTCGRLVANVGGEVEDLNYDCEISLGDLTKLAEAWLINYDPAQP